MASIYVRSTSGSDANDGSTWALAKATLAGAAAIASAGDTIYVSSVHSESTAAALDISLNGTADAPIQVLSVDDSAEPPTTLAPGATIATTGANRMRISALNSQFSYWDGITFNCGTGGTAASIEVRGKTLINNCTLSLNTTNASSRVSTDPAGSAAFTGCVFNFSATGQGLSIGASGAPTRILGGGIAIGSVDINNLLPNMGGGGKALFDGFDLSALAAAVNLAISTSANTEAEFRGCLLPASWTGALYTPEPQIGSLFGMYSCWSGATEIIWRRKLRVGEGRDETTLVRTGGGKHRGVGVSLKCDTNADAEYPLNTFDTLQFAAQVTAAQVGSPVTATVEILHDSVTPLTDEDIWLTVSGPKDEVTSGRMASVLDTPANHAASSATWTTTGMTNPNKQKLEVTWTPTKAGAVLGTVSIAAPSKTVYVDSMMTV